MKHFKPPYPTVHVRLRKKTLFAIATYVTYRNRKEHMIQKHQRLRQRPPWWSYYYALILLFLGWVSTATFRFVSRFPDPIPLCQTAQSTVFSTTFAFTFFTRSHYFFFTF